MGRPPDRGSSPSVGSLASFLFARLGSHSHRFCFLADSAPSPRLGASPLFLSRFPRFFSRTFFTSPDDLLNAPPRQHESILRPPTASY